VLFIVFQPPSFSLGINFDTSQENDSSSDVNDFRVVWRTRGADNSVQGSSAGGGISTAHPSSSGGCFSFLSMI
jgi:hypothetical protein